MQCQSLTTSGKRCKNNIKEGHFCWLHKEEKTHKKPIDNHSSLPRENYFSKTNYALFTINLLTLIVLGCTSYFGYRSFQISQNQNNVTEIVKSIERDEYLQDFDSEIYDFLLKFGQPYLYSFYYYEPPDTLPSLKRAKVILYNIIEDSVGTWSEIPELYSSLQALYAKAIDAVNQNEKARLKTQYDQYMNTFLLAEQTLFGVYYAFKGNRNNALPDDSYQDFSCYINDFGRNPIFLCAIYLNHTHKYFNKDFAEELQNLLKEEQFVQDLYPEMLSPEWIQHFE